MGSLTELLRIASFEVGTKEYPANSNSVKYNDWYYNKKVSGDQYPWCMVFCQWVYYHAGVGLPIKTGSCGAMMTAAQSASMLVKKDYQPGDLVLLAFNGTKIPTHCGIIEKVTSTRVHTIEGNTSTSSNDNGGIVMRRERYLSQCVAAVRPIFDEEVERMTIDEFISKLSDKQAYEIMKKAEAHADKQKAPTWVTKEGFWKAALNNKIVTSDTPEGHLKRDELISILGRLELLG